MTTIQQSPNTQPTVSQYESVAKPLETKLPELPIALKKMLCTLARYYDGQLHRFVLTPSGELNLKQVTTDSSELDTRSIILIVARGFYSEQARSYPIDNKKELKKLMVLEVDALEDSEGVFYHHWQKHNKTNNDKSGEQSQVNLWQYSNKVPMAFLRLPETLLLALTCEENQVLALTSTSDSELYVTRSNSSIYSLLKTPVINSVQRFSMSVGVTQSCSTKVVTAHGLATQLALGCKALSLPVIASFIQQPKVTDRIQLLKNIAIPLLLVLGVYLAGSSAYLLYKEQSLQQQLANQSSEVSVALTQQMNVDKNFSRYQALQHFVATQHNSSTLWLVMAELFPQAQFTNLQTSGGRYVLRGSTAKATALLEVISANQAVKGAKFDFPVRKNRGKERFVISFELIAIDSLIGQEFANGRA